MLTSDQKGAIAEAAIAHAALELGVGVARAYGDERYDLVFDYHPGLVRVQCKWACCQGDVVAIRCYSARRNADGLLRRFYATSEIDAFAAHCAELRRCYFLPLTRFAGRRQINLRLTPTLNNQARGVNWASDYDFAATLRSQQFTTSPLHCGASTGP